MRKPCSALLAPLTALTSNKVRWTWTVKHQNAFDAVKKIILRETLLSYPDLKQPFDVHTNASNLQLGTIISQNGKPMLFTAEK